VNGSGLKEAIPGGMDRAALEAPGDFDRIYEREFGYVVKTLRRLGVPERDLADVAQEVFLRVYEALSGFDTSRPLRPWLFGFALRTASNHSRLWQHRNVRPTAAEIDVADAGPNPEDSARAEEDRALLIRGLQTLSLPRRAVVVLHELDGLPIPEVAEVLRIPLNTAYSRLRRGLADLTKALRPAGGRHGR
jgi:RNA polymerase sigma-70 factor (ECF subfamily)